MGIKGLDKLIKEFVPHSVHEVPDLGVYRDKVMVVDASLNLFQSLIPLEMHSKTGGGEISHLMGILRGSVRLLKHGIKPLFVFDGNLAGRNTELMEKVANKYIKAQLGPPEKAGKEIGLIAETFEAIRNWKAIDSGYKNPTTEVKELLRLLGIPYLEAPVEAEAQCAALVKSGKAYAAVTENVDALIFGSNRLIRRLSFKASSKALVEDINLAEVLKGLNINQIEFIDLCILLGCDYCDTIKHIGPKKALKLVQRYRNIENVIENINKDKFKIPFFWTTIYPKYEKARQKFLNPIVFVCEKLGFEWRKPDKQGITDYICGPKQFNEAGIRRKLHKLLGELI